MRFSGGNVESRKNTFATMTPRSCTPMSCVARLRNVRRKSSPPNSSTSVIAICAETSIRRRPAPSLPAALRSRPTTGVPASRSAGARPNTSAVTSAAAVVNPNTRQSIDRSRWMRSTTVLINGGIDRLTTTATPSAAIDPRAASNRLSVNTCCSTRPRVPPIARRTANSWRRAVARASNRLARFTDAISRTSPATAIRIHNGRAYDRRSGETPADASTTFDSHLFVERGPVGAERPASPHAAPRGGCPAAATAPVPASNRA